MSQQLIFSGTNYLGVSQSRDFRRLVEQGFELFGLHYGGSRFSGLCPPIFNQAEKTLAKLSGAEEALIVSSGSSAGILATQLLEPSDHIIAAKDTHPALLNIKHKVSFYHSLSSAVADRIGPNGPLTILCNAIDPLHCRPTDFSFVNELNPLDLLIVDDSHGFGVTGENGGGIHQYLKEQTAAKIIVTGSLGKGFGVPGGVILSDADIIQKVKSLPNFGGGAPPPAAYIFAFNHGQDYYDEARKKLLQNIDYFKDKLKQIDSFRYLEDYPVFYTSKNELADYLLKEEIEISSFRYPTPQSDLITRIVLNSGHSLEDIDRLTTSINKSLKS